jgi:hypothetical protein
VISYKAAPKVFQSDVQCNDCGADDPKKTGLLRYDASDLKIRCSDCFVSKAEVILFKPGGKYYTEDHWRIPTGSIGPFDMQKSPDFRRISDGPVLIPTQEPWGYPHLFPQMRES